MKRPLLRGKRKRKEEEDKDKGKEVEEKEVAGGEETAVEQEQGEEDFSPLEIPVVEVEETL